MRIVGAPDFASLRARLAREVRALRADPLLPITIVVPRRTAREETRRRLARDLGGTFAVDVVPWSRWADGLAAAEIARARGRRLPEAGFERLAARILAGTSRATRRGPRPAEEILDARLVAASLAVLFEGGFDADALDASPPLARDPFRRGLGAILRRFEAALERERLWDRRRTERTAARALRDAPSAAAPAGVTLLFGFHDLTPPQRDIVLARAATCDVVLLVPGVSADAAGPGESAIAPLLAWARDAGAAIERTQRDAPPLVALEEDPSGAPALRDPGTARLELAAYATDPAEVRGIAGRILDLAAHDGRSWDDFLVTVPAGGGPSPLLFRRLFAKAGIPLRDGVGVSASVTRAGRLALRLARAVAAARDDRDREALEFVAPPERGGPDAEAAAEAFVRARDAEEARARFEELHRARLGEEPSDAVKEALESVALGLGGGPLSPRDFAEALAAALEGTRVRDDAGTGVLLVTMDAARGISRPVAFHAGLVRGAVRRPPAEDPLLQDAFRHALNETGGWRGRRLATAEDRRQERLLLARFAFEAATDRAVLSFAERERAGGEPRNPSGLLLDVVAGRVGRPVDPRGADFARCAPPRPAERVRARPVDATDADLAWFAAGPPGEDAIRAVLRAPRARHLPRAWRAAEARWGDPRPGPFDGALSDPRAVARLGERLGARRWSPTALETMANCPFAFLLRTLGLDESPEEPDDYDPRDRGGLFHAIYEGVSRTLRERGRLPLTPDALPEALALVDAAIARERATLASEPGRRRLERGGTLGALRADLAAALAREARRDPATRTVPERFELAFGGEDEGPHAAWELPGGARLPLRGKIDRVDRRADGDCEIVDLKTGVVRARTGSFRGPSDGRTEVRLQLPLYLHAASRLLGRPARRGMYWHATADAGFREIAYDERDLARDREEIGALLAHLVARVREGWFPSTPGPTACCRAGLAGACGPAVAERFLRKRDDPALAAHLARVRGGPAAPAAGAGPAEDEA